MDDVLACVRGRGRQPLDTPIGEPVHVSEVAQVAASAWPSGCPGARATPNVIEPLLSTVVD